MTCTASYTVTQADADHGRIDDSAIAQGTPPTGPEVSSRPSTWRVSIGRVGGTTAPALKVVKTPDYTRARRVGDVIRYRITVINTSDVIVRDIKVVDRRAGRTLKVTCPMTSLAPKASMRCTTSPYILTRADVAKGGVTNRAYALGASPDGRVVTSRESTAVVPVTLPVETVLPATGGNNRALFLVGLLATALGVLIMALRRRAIRPMR
jgi:LPXTG-motif cell wall-anchored protein